jgi:phosphatidylserine/phosphatidylglycerophosphate/cardiolipin synthase-like enzyme/membrane protein DedA with SNARE-associated domain
LREGANCWRIARADRASFIVDGEAYFAAVREAIGKAHHSVFILGWDIHSQVRLIRDGEADDALPTALGALVDAVASRRPELEVYILDWDFAMIYAMEREFFPRYKLRWTSHDRVHFCLDGEHPVGASQHQKIVVVDDKVAFSGGLDLSKWRWDSCAHLIDDERRIDPDGEPYPPFHDVQVIVDGVAACALGELARERWLAAGGVEPVPIRRRNDDDHDPWPSNVDSGFQRVDVGVSRTSPQYKDRDEVREVERLYLDSIEAARRFIYVENQYLSSHRIGQAFAKRLQEAEGPELIIIMPEQTGGWLEQHTMDVLRARLLRSLRDADRHGRLRVYYVRLAEEPNVTLMVHAKVMIIDDQFVRVASSNLSNRSMGLDSECDLAIESSESQDCGKAIAEFRRRLLAEHLGVSTDDLAAAESSTRSLIEVIESLRDGARTLMPLKAELSAELDQWVPESALLDPEKPVEPEELLDRFVGRGQQKSLRKGLIKLSSLLLLVLALVAAWRWTPLAEWLDLDNAAAIGEWMDAQRFTPALVLGTYLVAGSMGVPVTLLIIVTVMVFGPWIGMGYAMAGSELSALASFGIGHLLGRDAVSQIAGNRINRVSRTLSRRGLVTIITLRVVPVAPFAVINLIAGASEIRFRDFAIGSLIGMVPGVLAAGFLTDRVVASLREPGATTIGTAVVAIAIVAAGLLGLRHWLRKSSRRNAQDD